MLYLIGILELSKASKEINLNLIAPELPKGTLLFNAWVEKPNKEENILAKNSIQDK